MNVTITFANKVESYYTRADGSAALSKDVLELNVLRLPPAAALGPGGSLDEFWTRAAQHCGVAEVEIDGKLVYPF